MPVYCSAAKRIARNFCYIQPVVTSYLLTTIKSLSSKSPLNSTIMSSKGEKGLSTNSQEGGLLIKDVVAKLESWAPLLLAGSWDKVGLQVEPSGDSNRVSRVMLTNDLTEAVVEEAVEKEIGMIISYHPPIFQALKTLTNRSWKERVIRTCIENKIAVYSPHTAWDAVNGGVNDWLATAFETSSVKPLTVSKTWVSTSDSSRESHFLEVVVSKEDTSTDKLRAFCQEVGASFKHIVHAEDGKKIMSFGCNEKSLACMLELIEQSQSSFSDITMKFSKCEQIPWPGNGEGRLCLLKEPTPLMKIVERVKQHLGLKNVRLAVACNASTESQVQSVALCAGSGSSVLSGVRADVFLTGEMGHHEVLEANHRGSHVILCEHSNTERGFIRSLVDEGFMNKLLGGSVDVVMSSKDQEPLVVV